LPVLTLKFHHQDGGSDIPVTTSNVDEYIDAVVEAIVGKGVQLQAQAFREGFSRVFPVSDLQAFSADELAMLFGNADEDWSVESMSATPTLKLNYLHAILALCEALKADHGFSTESRAIRDLVEVMSCYTASERRDYLQFITGSPKLPIGGLFNLRFFRTWILTMTCRLPWSEPPTHRSTKTA
jgi:E3 ubiquitin-protein ligase TRIP12